MRIAIYQPRYFPQLHYFNRMLDSDIFVILDSAQYTKSLSHYTATEKKRSKSYQSDTPIKKATGQHLLTVPVKHDGLSSINATSIDYSHKWVMQHLKTIKYLYNKSAFFKEAHPQLSFLLSQKYNSLADLNIETIIWGLHAILGIPYEFRRHTINELNKKLQKTQGFRLKRVELGSKLDVKRPEGLHKGTEWTTDICKAFGANEYLYGGTAQAGYMNLEHYKKHGIRLIKQNWKCEEYEQQFAKKGFIANLSIIDLVMNVDPVIRKKIMRGIHIQNAFSLFFLSMDHLFSVSVLFNF